MQTLSGTISAQTKRKQTPSGTITAQTKRAQSRGQSNKQSHAQSRRLSNEQFRAQSQKNGAGFTQPRPIYQELYRERSYFKFGVSQSIHSDLFHLATLLKDSTLPFVVPLSFKKALT